MIASTVVLFLSAMLFRAVVIAQERARREGATYTFLVDPPTMLFAGIVAAFVAMRTRAGRTMLLEQFRMRRIWADRALTVFFAAFWCMELLSYFDVMRNPYDASKSGNDFMWNGYVDLLGWQPFHFAQPTYYYWWTWLLLPAMALVQWCALRLGAAVVYARAWKRIDDSA